MGDFIDYSYLNPDSGTSSAGFGTTPLLYAQPGVAPAPVSVPAQVVQEAQSVVPHLYTDMEETSFSPTAGLDFNAIAEQRAKEWADWGTVGQPDATGRIVKFSPMDVAGYATLGAIVNKYGDTTGYIPDTSGGGFFDNFKGIASVLSGGISDLFQGEKPWSSAPLAGTLITGGLSDSVRGEMPFEPVWNPVFNALGMEDYKPANVEEYVNTMRDAIAAGNYAEAFDAWADPTERVNTSLERVGSRLPAEVRAVAPLVGSLIGTAIYPVAGTAAGYGVGSHLAGKDSEETIKGASIAALGSYLSQLVAGLSTEDVSSAFDQANVTAGEGSLVGRTPISAAEWDQLYGGSPFEAGSAMSELYTGGVDVAGKLLSKAKLTPAELDWINGPGYVDPDILASLEAERAATQKATQELPYKEPVPYNEVAETPTALTPEQRGLLPASEAGGDVDQGWSTTGVPEQEQGPTTGPSEADWDVASDIGSWKKWADIAKQLAKLLSGSGDDSDTIVQGPTTYSWFGGSGSAVDMGGGGAFGGRTKKTMLSNLEAEGLRDVQFPFDPEWLNYMDQYAQTNYTG